jgi:RNA polymerase sigma-70 factor (ECF subfamily)
MSDPVETLPPDSLNGNLDGSIVDDATEPAVARPTDPALFERETGPHIDALYRNALRLTGNANDAEDLVQDTYLRAYRFFYQYHPGTNAKAWLFRIMNTVFLNEYRRKSRQADTVSYDGLEDFYLYNKIAEDSVASPQRQAASNPEDLVLHKLDREAIEAAISRLPVEFRDTVALATLEGLAYQEISDILQIPIGTVRSRLSRGRRLLQKALWNQLSALPEENLQNDARDGTSDPAG